MIQKKYDEVHFFIDESGDIKNTTDTLLVGGVVVFGTFGKEEDKQLKDITLRNLDSTNGIFPENLHYSTKPNPKVSKKNFAKTRFFKQMSNDLLKYHYDNNPLFGIAMLHVEDYHKEESVFSDESKLDNRYIQMLWALLEHHLFVDNKFTELLTDDAKVHLYIATRGFKLDDAELQKLLESSGVKVVPDRDNNNKLFVPTSVTNRQIMGMLQMAQSHRWKKTKKQFASLNIIKADYISGESLIPLYLADIYLGSLREKIKYRQQSPAFSIPHFDVVEYGQWLELLADMKSSLMNGQIDSYMNISSNYYQKYAHKSNLSDIAVSLDIDAALQLKSSLDKLIPYMKNVCREIDTPGHTNEGMNKANRLFCLMDVSGASNIALEILYLQACLSYANHQGDISKANSVWLSYKKREPGLLRIGTEGVRLMAEMRNRRAVSLTDNFMYKEAEEVLLDIISDTEQEMTKHAKRFNINVNELPNYELGACYGTLGQVYAFMGGKEDRSKATRAFSRAVSRFTDPLDIERQYVYLGHLACDMGEQGRNLWKEVEIRIPRLQNYQPINETGSQFLLHLQSKALFTFGTKENIIEFLTQWGRIEKKLNYSEEEKKLHPFGLIYQSFAMNYTRLFAEEDNADSDAELSLTYFDLAKNIMNHKGALLQLLAYVAELRKCLFRLTYESNTEHIVKQITYAVSLLKSHMLAFFGGDILNYSDDEQDTEETEADTVKKAKRIIKAIKFNYW